MVFEKQKAVGPGILGISFSPTVFINTDITYTKNEQIHESHIIILGNITINVFKLLNHRI